MRDNWRIHSNYRPKLNRSKILNEIKAVNSVCHKYELSEAKNIKKSQIIDNGAQIDPNQDKEKQNSANLQEEQFFLSLFETNALKNPSKVNHVSYQNQEYRFCQSMKQKNSKPQLLALDNLPFSIDNEPLMEKITEHIRIVQKHVSVLDISGNKLGLNTIKMFSFYGLNRNNSLIKLNMSNTALNKDSIEYLLENILRYNQSLIDIDLSNSTA